MSKFLNTKYARSDLSNVSQQTIVESLPSVGNGLNLIGDNGFKSLISGAGISIIDGVDEITFTAPGSIGENNTLSSVTSGGISLVSPKTGVVLNTKGLKAGAGISITSDSNDLTITNSTQPGLNYRGLWDALINVPVLTNTPEASGNYYIVSTPGSTNLNGIIDWSNSDWVISNGTVWQKIDNSEVLTPVSITNLQAYQGLIRNATNTAYENVNVLQQVNNVGLTGNLVSTVNTNGIATLKGIGSSGISMTSTVNNTDIVFTVSKLNTANTVQVSDSVNGWKILEATGSCSFQHNNIPKFVIPSNDTFTAGWTGNVAGMLVPKGTTAQRSNSMGSTRYNTTTNKFEYCNNINAWISPTENTSFSSVQGSDLSLVGATSGQVLAYNGTQWLPSTVSTSGENNTMSNLGGAVGIFKSKTGVNFDMKTISAGSNINFNTTDPNVIAINSTAEVNTASNVGSGQGIFKQKTGVNLEMKTLIAGSGVTITNNTNDLTIAASGGGSTTISVDPACPFLSAFLSGSNYTLSTRGADTIRLGTNAGGSVGTGNAFGISIGDNSGVGTGVERLHFGSSSGAGGSSNNNGMALGALSGHTNLGARATAIGFQAGFNNLATDSIAIGPYAGYSGTAAYSVSIGYQANQTAPAANCIVINATGSALNGSGVGTFINPIANKTNQPEQLCYNNTTKEVSFQKAFQLYTATTAERNVLSGVNPGSMIYNTSTGLLDIWTGTVWRSL